MTSKELIACLQAINQNESRHAQLTDIHIDAIDTPEANYVVALTWKNDNVDIYITDDADDLINNLCYDDYFEMLTNIKNVHIYESRNDGVHCKEVL